jgi:hypothetical protein
MTCWSLALLFVTTGTVMQRGPSGDEQELVAIQQMLARAWASRDRQTIERILAPEWSVITPDGSTVPRLTALDGACGSNAPTIETMTTDDVSVGLYGSAAVVRGRTVATVTLRGTAQTTRIRFTDLCVKREGAWQVVASHQSRLGPER